MSALIDADGNKMQAQETITAEAAIERALTYIKSLLAPSYDLVVILRHKAGPDHVIYTEGSLADVMKAIYELQTQYQAGTVQ